MFFMWWTAVTGSDLDSRGKRIRRTVSFKAVYTWHNPRASSSYPLNRHSIEESDSWHTGRTREAYKRTQPATFPPVTAVSKPYSRRGFKSGSHALNPFDGVRDNAFNIIFEKLGLILRDDNSRVCLEIDWTEEVGRYRNKFNWYKKKGKNILYKKVKLFIL
jgi:hypothetical protein